ncbi:MAG: hypothetical protein JSS20_16645 [Proteobacteria bacterium]|nr:hypothetical protein [Pseudomonadota bacterium]
MTPNDKQTWENLAILGRDLVRWAAEAQTTALPNVTLTEALLDAHEHVYRLRCVRHALHLKSKNLPVDPEKVSDYIAGTMIRQCGNWERDVEEASSNEGKL